MISAMPALKTKGIEVISSKKIHDGPAFSVFSDIVREGRHVGQRDVVRHGGSVVIAAFDDSRAKKDPKILLVRQYRYAADAYLWELPAGRVDRLEEKLDGAKRELREETGVTAKKWKHLFTFYASPGFLDETMDVYLARDLKRGKAQPEDDEQIHVRWVTLRQSLKMVLSNQIRDAKTISTVLWLAHVRPA